MSDYSFGLRPLIWYCCQQKYFDQEYEENQIADDSDYQWQTVEALLSGLEIELLMFKKYSDAK